MTCNSLITVALATVIVVGCGAVEEPIEESTTAVAPTTTETDPSTLASSTTAAPTTTAAPATTEAGSAVVVATITISGFSFGEPITVSAGDTIRVTNDDPFAHTWTADEGEFSSGGLGPGESYEYTFETAGEFAFHCSIHREMTGSVTVEG